MHPVRVKLRLKKSQRITDKEWKVTIAGVVKTHTDEWVIYRAESIEVALRSFDPKEILSVLIEDESHVS